MKFKNYNHKINRIMKFKNIVTKFNRTMESKTIITNLTNNENLELFNINNQSQQ